MCKQLSLILLQALDKLKTNKIEEENNFFYFTSQSDESELTRKTINSKCCKF